MKDPVQERLTKWLNRPVAPQGVAQANGLGAISTVLGTVRKENQDRAVIARYTGNTASESFVFFGLCDGIGGLKHGNICASRTLATVLTMLVSNRSRPLSTRLPAALAAANEDLFQEFKEEGGATFSGIVVTGSGGVMGLNVGDSRIYELSDNALVQVSSDDNVQSQLQLIGKPQENLGRFGTQLLQFVGMGRELVVKPIGSLRLNNPFLLTSDGIQALGMNLLTEIIAIAPNLPEAARRVNSVCKWCKGADNATLVCILPNAHLTFGKSSVDDVGTLEVWDSFTKLELVSLPSPPRQFEKRPRVQHTPMLNQQPSKKQGGKKYGRKDPGPEPTITEVKLTEEPPK